MQINFSKVKYDFNLSKHHNNKENQINIQCKSLIHRHLYCYVCVQLKISRRQLFNFRHYIIKQRKKREKKNQNHDIKRCKILLHNVNNKLTS